MPLNNTAVSFRVTCIDGRLNIICPTSTINNDWSFNKQVMLALYRTSPQAEEITTLLTLQFMKASIFKGIDTIPIPKNFYFHGVALTLPVFSMSFAFLLTLEDFRLRFLCTVYLFTIWHTKLCSSSAFICLLHQIYSNTAFFTFRI